MLVSRATDGLGILQPADFGLAEPNGATGGRASPSVALEPRHPPRMGEEMPRRSIGRRLAADRHVHQRRRAQGQRLLQRRAQVSRALDPRPVDAHRLGERSKRSAAGR